MGTSVRRSPARVRSFIKVGGELKCEANHDTLTEHADAVLCCGLEPANDGHEQRVDILQLELEGDGHVVLRRGRSHGQADEDLVLGTGLGPRWSHGFEASVRRTSHARQRGHLPNGATPVVTFSKKKK